MILTQSALYDIRRELTRRRHQLGLSQTAVGKRMGYHPATVSILEAGVVHRPNLYTIIAWADALDYHINLTFTEKG